MSHNDSRVAMIYRKDEFGLGVSLPYIAVKLSAHEVGLLKGKAIHVYSTNGKNIFDIVDKNDERTGEAIFFVVFS